MTDAISAGRPMGLVSMAEVLHRRKLDEQSPRAIELDSQMKQNWDNLIPPPNAEIVGKMVNVGRELK